MSEVSTESTELPVVCVVCDAPAVSLIEYFNMAQPVCEYEACREASIDSMRTLKSLLETYELVAFEEM